jgi:integrase/recombinase XerD
MKTTIAQVKVPHKNYSITTFVDSKECMATLPLHFFSYMYISPDYSKETLSTYTSCIFKYVKYLFESGEANGLSIDQAILMAGTYQVNNFLYELRMEEYSDDYICTIDAALKTFYEWIELNKTLWSDIHIEIDSPYRDGRSKALRPYNKNVNYINRDDLITLMNTIEHERYKCLLHFLYESGVRISEALRFTIKDFKDAKPLYKSDWFKLNVKGGKARGGMFSKGTIRISRTVLERVLESINERNEINVFEPAFINLRGTAVKRNSIQNFVRRTSKRLLDGGEIRERLTLHMLRHSAAFSMMTFVEGINSIENLIHVKQALRHKSIISTEVYTTVDYVEVLESREDSLSAGIQSRLHEAKFILTNTTGFKL